LCRWSTLGDYATPPSVLFDTHTQAHTATTVHIIYWKGNSNHAPWPRQLEWAKERGRQRESEREPEQDEHVFIFSQNISCKLRAKNKKNTHALILSRSKWPQDVVLMPSFNPHPPFSSLSFARHLFFQLILFQLQFFILPLFLTTAPPSPLLPLPPSFIYISNCARIKLLWQMHACVCVWVWVRVRYISFMYIFFLFCAIWIDINWSSVHV